MSNKNNHSEKITGFVLAGGKSKRFGSDKSLAVFDGKPLIVNQYEQLRRVCERVIVLSNIMYPFHRGPIISDIVENFGPIGGIHAGMKAAFTEFSLFVPCDLPLMNGRALKLLIESLTTEEAACFSIGGRVEPMPLMIKSSVITKVIHLINHKRYSIYGLIENLNMVILPIEHSEIGREIFSNCNTIEQLNAVRKTQRS